MRIVDCHLHLNGYGALEGLTLPQRVEGLRAQLRKWNVDHGIVLSSYLVNEMRPSTQEILDAIGDDPTLSVVEGIGIGRQDVDWTPVEERLKAGKTKGVKIYPGYDHAYPTDPRFRPAIELCARHKVPLMVHTGDTYAPRAKLKFAHPLIIDDLCVDYPDVKFIICHCGNPWFDDTAAILYKNDNAYADISGLILEEFTVPVEAHMREELRNLILYTGDPQRILYGTDWPLVRMGPYLRFVDHLGLKEEHRAMLLADNAARLFDIPVHPKRPKEKPMSAVGKGKERVTKGIEDGALRPAAGRKAPKRV